MAGAYHNKAGKDVYAWGNIANIPDGKTANEQNSRETAGNLNNDVISKINHL